MEKNNTKKAHAICNAHFIGPWNFSPKSTRQAQDWHTNPLC